MKNSLHLLSLSAVAAAMLPLSAQAADATLKFTGEVVASTCSISAGVNGTGTSEIVVVLPSIGESSLANAEARAGSKNFQVLIGGPGETDCVGGVTQKASIAFDTLNSPLIDPGTGRLNNSGTASNVQVELVNPASGAAINTFTGANVPSASITNGQGTLDLAAQYVANGAAAGEGTVNTSVGFFLVYF